MMDAVRAELAELGVPNEQVQTEAFAPAEGMAPPDTLEAPHPAEAAVPPGPGPPPPAAPAAAVTRVGNGAAAPLAAAQIRFAVSGKTGALLPNQPVLEAAEAIGVDIDYSCRVGICGVCKIKLLEGAVTMAVEEGLEPSDKERALILACQAKSTSNVVVEA